MATHRFARAAESGNPAQIAALLAPDVTFHTPVLTQDLFELDAEGRVVNQTVWLRPWPVTTILRDAAIAGQLPSLPADYWLLPAAPSQLS